VGASGRVPLCSRVAALEACDEIRQFGTGSVQVMRRLRSALSSITDAAAYDKTRAAILRAYLKQLDAGISRSQLDAEDRLVASQEDRQGLGLSRKLVG